MKRSLLVVGLAVATASFAAQSSAGKSRTLESSAVVHLKLSDLRSAYLLRAGIVRYDAAHSTPDGIRVQLQRHFDTVIGLLLISTPSSIEIAVARLEAADDHSWSTAERASWRQRLVVSRWEQLQRLAFYRDRGLFPLNEGQVDEPAPIFVDGHDTACAVGQLMRWSDWDDEVAAISRDDNLVYVPNSQQTSMGQWVLTSGLTIEEAALIQPGYEYPAEFNLTDYSPNGLTLIKSGLKFSNFTMQSDNWTVSNSATLQAVCGSNSSSCNPTSLKQLAVITPRLNDPSLPNPALVSLYIASGDPPFPAGFEINGNRWINIGSAFQHGIQGNAEIGRAQHIQIEFDLATDSPTDIISSMGEHTNYFHGGFSPNSGFGAVPASGDAMFFFDTQVKSDQVQLASTNLNRTSPGDNPFGWAQSSNATFNPIHKAHIVSNLWVFNGVHVDGYFLDFNLATVPEPSSLCLIITSLAAITYPRRRAISRSPTN